MPKSYNDEDGLSFSLKVIIPRQNPLYSYLTQFTLRQRSTIIAGLALQGLEATHFQQNNLKNTTDFEVPTPIDKPLTKTRPSQNKKTTTISLVPPEPSKNPMPPEPEEVHEDDDESFTGLDKLAAQLRQQANKP